MLRCLRVKNLAIVEDLTWELESGFNVLTGETGAGKSILIDALNLLLGERADKSLIRDGADSCAVEAVLESPPFLKVFLEQQGIENAGEDGLILKRVFTAQGQNRQFINGSPSTLQTLKALGDFLVDMHGPHDHQSLLSADAQLAALDAFSKLDEKLEAYRFLYREHLRDQAQLEELRKTEAGNREERLAFLEFQINEIEQARLLPNEEETLEREHQLASHHRRIMEIGAAVRGILGEGEQDVHGRLEAVERLLQEWERLDPSAAVLREHNNEAIVRLRELEREAGQRMEQTELDAERLQEMETRLNLIQSLKRKHGADIFARLEELKEERDALAGREARIAELEAAIQGRLGKLEQLAAELSRAREKSAPKLGKDITAQLRELSFKQADFSTRLAALSQLTASGKDSVEFLFAPNPGESARPLRAIASSGEMARVMLAVKTVLAAQDRVPILIFDEIDANVGGETAVAVGKKLRKLASAHQVLCITHLPQVAAHGDAHYCVEKKIRNGRTVVVMERLNGDNREEELARMLGGQSQSARALAQAMLKEQS
ncbi:MAG: DNA repair protein RecN [bacterium]